MISWSYSAYLILHQQRDGHQLRTFMSGSHIAIIGGGLSGLVCARHLMRVGVDCVVYDRGRRPGGRVSSKIFTHQSTPHLVNHGAPKLDCAEKSTQEIMQDLGVMVSGRGVIHSPDMHDVIEQFAMGVRVESSTEVLRIHRGNDRWMLDVKHYGVPDEDQVKASRIVFACPVPQVSRVLRASRLDLPREFDQVAFDAQWVLMGLAAFEGESKERELGSPSSDADSCFESVEFNHHSNTSIFIARVRTDRSNELKDSPREEVHKILLKEFTDLLSSNGVELSVHQSAIHRWGLARARSQIKQRFLPLQAESVYCICDQFSGPDGLWRDTDAAVLSGASLARALTSES